ncbi:MAG TPA: hypothetical protein EYN66_04360 [Myxococcales bacterium]|nr:hypothetical protein [Myxococcales bacterium]
MSTLDFKWCDVDPTTDEILAWWVDEPPPSAVAGELRAWSGGPPVFPEPVDPAALIAAMEAGEPTPMHLRYLSATSFEVM